MLYLLGTEVIGPLYGMWPSGDMCQMRESIDGGDGNLSNLSSEVESISMHHRPGIGQTTINKSIAFLFFPNLTIAVLRTASYPSTATIPKLILLETSRSMQKTNSTFAWQFNQLMWHII